jgi:hypothetical protein
VILHVSNLSRAGIKSNAERERERQKEIDGKNAGELKKKHNNKGEKRAIPGEREAYALRRNAQFRG